jgi:hypothetical protein
VRTDTGNPVTLKAPSEPGSYELRYYAAGSRQIAASQALVVE